jgi:O-antigen ligase
MLLVFGGRQTSINTTEGSSQSRLQIWSVAFEMFRSSPVIGTGIDRVFENTGHASHNALIRAWAELGFLGGAFLFGQYFYCLSNLVKLGPKHAVLADPELQRLHPFLLASLAGFAVSEMSLTNGFSLVTYVMLGLSTAFIRQAEASLPPGDLFLSRRLIVRTTIFSGLLLTVLYLFTVLNVQ